MIKLVLKNKKIYSEKELKKLKKSLEYLEYILNSNLFKEKVLIQRFKDSGGLSCDEIYNKITHNYTKDKKTVIEVTLDIYKVSGTLINSVKYSQKSILKTYLFKHIFKYLNKEKIASILIHNLAHKIGFTHKGIFSRTRKYSVPYSLEKIVYKFQ